LHKFLPFNCLQVTYGALRVLSNRLANAIVSSGLGKGEVVGIYGHRSPAVVVCIMGVLKAGAAYCMLDPKYPPDRINVLMEIASVRGMLSIEAAGALPAEVARALDARGLAFRLSVPATDSEAVASGGFLREHGDAAPAVQISGDDVAVVTFTSGSTGIPKGVQGRHLPLTHFYPWMARRFKLGAEDRFSMCSGIAHDPLQRDIFTPLFFGSSVLVPTDADIGEPGQLARWFAQHQVSKAPKNK
jgi:L-aminoadipate-semialdehyde dehydrogenase